MGGRSDPFDCCVVNAILPQFARGQNNYTRVANDVVRRFELLDRAGEGCGWLQ